MTTAESNKPLSLMHSDRNLGIWVVCLDVAKRWKEV